MIKKMDLKIFETEKHGVRIFYADVSELDITKDYPELSQYRRRKISELKRCEDKKLSLGAELLLIYAIEKYYPDISIPLNYGFSERGKPYINGVHFNLAHSGSAAICAVADTDIGIDIEKTSRTSETVAKRAFCENELKYDFAYIWTRKEAAVKADGGGIAVGLRELDVTGDVVQINGVSYRLVSFKPEITGYDAAFCVKSDVDDN